jgi:hypothetical protein
MPIMNRRTVIIIAVIAIAIVAFALARQMRTRSTQATAEYETVAAYRDTIVATVNSSGSVLPRKKVSLAFPSSLRLGIGSKRVKTWRAWMCASWSRVLPKRRRI